MKHVIVLFSAVCSLIVLSCRNNANQKSQVGDAADVDSALSIVKIHINDRSKPLYDVITRDNIIEDIKYIPLETNENSLIGDGNIYKIGGNYVVEDRAVFYSGIKVFGPDGKYIEEHLNIGNGPTELPMNGCSIHDYINKRLIYAGSDKVIVLDLTTHEKSVIRVNESLYFHFSTGVLDNGDFVTPVNEGRLIDKGDGKHWYPLYYFTNSDFTGTDTILSYRKLVRWEEWTDPSISTFDLVYGNDKRILSRSKDSDTVFEVKNDRSFVPAIVLDIPKKLFPTIEDMSDSKEDKMKMIYIKDLFESKDYVFVVYQHAGLFYTGIWEKKSGKYVASSIASFGTTVIVPVDNANYMYQYRFNYVEWETNTIVTSITAKAAQDRIPGLKADDNPVVVEIKLKTP